MRRAAFAVICAALVIAFTWPLARNPAGFGRVDSGDGQFSIWNVGWVARSLTAGNRHVFDANIFHPQRGTLAYSEANLGAGVLGVPAYLATGSAVAAHNVAVLIAFALALTGTTMLALRLTGSWPGAVAAGIVFTFCPYVFSHTAHVQLMMTFGLPWVLLAMHAFVDAPSWGRAIVLGVALAVAALFCGYYGMLAGLLVGIACVYYAWTRGAIRRPLWWGQVALAAAVSVAAVLPFFLPYMSLQRETGFARDLEESYRYAATWRAYLASSALVHRWMLAFIGRPEEVLFPGFVALTLGAIGAVRGLRRPAVGNGMARSATRETAAFYVLVGVFALWISFGPAAGLYSLLYKTIPMFSLLRAPSRFGIAVQLSLAVLTAIGVAVLSGGGRRRGVLGIVICALAVVDLWTPWPAIAVPARAPAYEVLSQLRPGPVVELPFFWRPIDFHRHALYMLNSTYHWQPLVNGYSDYIPPDFVDVAVPLSSFPTRESFDILQARRVRYVVFHPNFYSRSSLAAMKARLETFHPFLRGHVVEGDVWLYEIVGWP